MAIIIRESKTLPNGEVATVKQYISDISPLTGNLRKKAEEYDLLIEKKVEDIEEELDKLGLFELRNRPQVLQLWYEFGKRLTFINDFELSPTAKKFIWRAVYDHTKKLYDHPRELPIRLLRAPTTSNLSYAYLIGSMDWEFVNAAGNWTAWVEFLDSEVIRNDKRIQNWIRDLQVRGPLQGGFLRVLNRTIRRRFDGIDTPSLPDEGLIEILEETLEDALSKRE
jgi:hypothetical protein